MKVSKKSIFITNVSSILTLSRINSWDDTLIPSLRVHVAPVGDDIPDRILIPLQVEEADKVYLLTMRGNDVFASRFNLIKQEMINRGIIRPERVYEIRENLYDFTALMCCFARICREEQVIHHNRVHFNVSTGGKLVAHAAMLASRIFDAIPYYCKQNYPSKSIPSPPKILTFPSYPVERPDPEVIQFLVNLRKKMQETKREWASKTECLQFAPSTANVVPSTQYKKIKYKYLDKLSKWGFITIEERLRGKVRLTDEGHFAAQVFSTYYAID